MKNEDLEQLLEPGSITPGIYRHYKGGLYQVMFEAKNTETRIQEVIYQNLEHGTYYCRDKKVFLETVEYGDARVARFQFIRGANFYEFRHGRR